LRNPRAKWAYEADTLKTITGSNKSAADTQTNNASFTDKSATNSAESAHSQTPASNGTVNTKESVGPGVGAVNAYTFLPPNSTPPYSQPHEASVVVTAAARDKEAFMGQMQTFGYPLSDSQFQIIDRENRQRFIELLFDPERWLWAMQLWGRLSQGAVGNSLAKTAQQSFTNATSQIIQPNNSSSGTGNAASGTSSVTQLLGMKQNIGSFINVANDSVLISAGPAPFYQSVQGAVGRVQQLYKYVFVPMALLFLLPGAVITQMRSQIAQGFGLRGEESSSPFEGILRAMIALFLIPATQLIVSYSTDIGNSLAYSVGQFVQQDVILGWANELAYDPPPNMYNNAIIPASTAGSKILNAAGMGTTSTPSLMQDFSTLGGDLSAGNFAGAFKAILSLFGVTIGYSDPGQGLAANQPSTQVHLEDQSMLSQMLQFVFNVATTMLSNLLLIATAFQLVFMCYLYLLGPLAAAFYAWPKLSSTMFRDIFGNWVVAVIQLSLWRFYWMAILAVMTTRLVYIQHTGQHVNLQWEIAVFACFVGLMFYVPMCPWTFDPGSTFTQVASIGAQMVGGEGGKGGGMIGQMAQQMHAAGMSDAQIQQLTGAVESVTVPMYGQATAIWGANAAAHPGQEGGQNMFRGQDHPGGPPPSAGAPTAPGAGSGSPGTGAPPVDLPPGAPAPPSGPPVPPASTSPPTAGTPHAEATPADGQITQSVQADLAALIGGIGARQLASGGGNSGFASLASGSGQSPQSSQSSYTSPADRGSLAGSGTPNSQVNPSVNQSVNPSAQTASPPPVQVASNAEQSAVQRLSGDVSRPPPAQQAQSSPQNPARNRFAPDDDSEDKTG
jgi:hypothetical protein